MLLLQGSEIPKGHLGEVGFQEAWPIAGCQADVSSRSLSAGFNCLLFVFSAGQKKEAHVHWLQSGETPLVSPPVQVEYRWQPAVIGLSAGE